ncbi:hotdog fold thioesterase [Teredinibacter sp. KSP-S5-2]|uniref:hotdog fold thioesterase n=1 Tax=Teredinibacter sp. KSP-S5-2 TaxID=3034506 RepID=UPI002934CFF8|nr:hotdog fold thioesterase [Teredinibacter sp. KSP-S5-2]WNO09379.1 hotdog fold thioesterase [Teredinibacter sp. KSP-S5-2]
MSIWKKEIPLHNLNRSMPGTLMETLDIRVTEVLDDGVVGTMPVDERTFQPMKLLHGGASVALAETLGSMAGHHAAEEGKTVVGLEINANHIKSAKSGLVTGKAKAVHIGKSTQVWEVHIYNNREQLICLSRLTLAVVNDRSQQ